MARFAGDNIAAYLSSDNRPDFGELSQKADDMRTDEANAYTDMAGETTAQGISTSAAVAGNELVQDAVGKLAGAQGEAQMMSSIGDIGSSLIGGLGSFGGGGGGGGTGKGYSGYSYSDFSKSMNSNPFAR